MKTTQILGIATLMLAGLVANAHAQGRGIGRGPGDGARLNLTAEQKQKVKGLREAMQTKAEPLHKEMQAKAAEMKQLWLTDRPDKNAIERKQNEMDSLHHKVRALHTDFKLQMHAILTPEQRAIWAEHQAMGPGKGGGRGKGRGFMHGGGPGGPADCPNTQP